MNKLSTEQTKEYLKCAFDLESELFKYRKLLSDYQQLRKNNSPKAPEMILPKKPTLIVTESKEATHLGNFAAIFVFLIVSIIIATFFENIIISLIFIAIGMTIKICELATYREKENAKNIEKQQNFDAEMEIYNNNVKQEEIRYNVALETYSKAIEVYNKETNLNVNDINKTITTLSDSLKELYAQDIILSKYRDIVAVSKILEYFEAGRCSELEGTNGAYNMYENELRTNLIVSSLSEIISNLQQIKNNQYTLYNMINNSTKEIKNLILNLHSGQAITAEYAKATAIATYAHKFII